MHQQLQEIGPHIYEKLTAYYIKKFEADRKQNEQKITESFEKEKIECIDESRKKYEKMLKREEKKFREKVNKTLYSEAREVKTKEWLRHQSEYAEGKSRGEEDFKKALEKARADFEEEKRSAIKDRLNELTIISNEKRTVINIEYENAIENINTQWIEKMKDLEETRRQARLEELSTIAHGIELLQRDLDKKLAEIMAAKKEEETLQEDFMQRKLDVEIERNEILRGNYLALEMKKTHIILQRENVIKNFKNFIASVRGLSAGDASNILMNIIA